MPGPSIGDKVKVGYTDGFSYTLHVKVTAICSPSEFVGFVEAIFGAGEGELFPGNKIVSELKGQNRRFKTAAIIP